MVRLNQMRARCRTSPLLTRKQKTLSIDRCNISCNHVFPSGVQMGKVVFFPGAKATNTALVEEGSILFWLVPKQVGTGGSRA